MIGKPCRLASFLRIAFFALTLFSAGGMPVAIAGVNAWTTSWPTANAAQTLAPDPSGQSSVYAGAFGPVLLDLKNGNWERVADGTGSTFVNLNAVAVDSKNPKTIYVGVSNGLFTPTGGIYKSTDGGREWLFGAVHESDPVLSIIVDPSTEGTVYAVVLFCSCLHRGCITGQSCDRHLYKSTDFGVTWTRLGGLFLVSAFVIDPIVPSTLFVTAYGGVFKSLDGGSTWTATNSGFGASCLLLGNLTISHTDPAVLFVATGGTCPAAAYKTTDGGSTWKPTALATAEVGFSTSIVVDPTNEKAVYLTAVAVTPGSGGLFRSVDGGESWSHFDEGLPGPNIGPVAIERDGATIHVLVGNRIFDYSYVPPLRSPVRAISGSQRATSLPPR